MTLLYSEKLPIGWEAIDFKLKDTEGKEHALKEFADKKGLLIVFTCNHCPYAEASWPILINLAKEYSNQVAVVAINPNDAEQYPEDSFEEMKKRKKEWGIPFPYLLDETQEVAQAYKAQCTPDTYLFNNKDGKFKLYYHGRINDKNLEDAINALLSGKEPSEVQPPSMGCSIKWKSET